MQTLLVCIAYYLTDVVNVSTGPSHQESLQNLNFGNRLNIFYFDTDGIVFSTRWLVLLKV